MLFDSLVKNALKFKGRLVHQKVKLLTTPCPVVPSDIPSPLPITLGVHSISPLINHRNMKHHLLVANNQDAHSPQVYANQSTFPHPNNRTLYPTSFNFTAIHPQHNTTPPHPTPTPPRPAQQPNTKSKPTPPSQKKMCRQKTWPFPCGHIYVVNKYCLRAPVDPSTGQPTLCRNAASVPGRPRVAPTRRCHLLSCRYTGRGWRCCRCKGVNGRMVVCRGGGGEGVVFGGGCAHPRCGGCVETAGAGAGSEG